MEELLIELEKAIQSIDQMENELEFHPIAEEILNKIKSLPNKWEAVEKILKIIEENNDKEYGGPGPVGHFLESFYGNGYENLLVQSLKRKPGEYTIYLLHRCINDEKNPNRQEHINLLKKIANDAEIPEEIREEAKESLEYFE